MSTTTPISKISPLSALIGKPRNKIVRVKWQKQEPPPHEFEAVACPEEEGGYSVFAANYPGVISQGDTLEEAEANVREAFTAMLESRRKHREKMAFSFSPWMEISPNCKRLRVKVDG